MSELLDAVVNAAIDYNIARGYYYLNEGSYSALADFEYKENILEDAIDAEFVERNKAT